MDKDSWQPDNEPGLHHRLDILLAKYSAIWLWSIIFGGTSGLGYNFVSSSFLRGQVGPLSFTLASLTAMGILLVAQAWLLLYRYFRLYLVRMVFGFEHVEQNEERSRDAARMLSRALFYMIAAGLVTLMMSVLRLAFDTLA